MTFTVTDTRTGLTEVVDLEDLGDLQTLASRYGWAVLEVDVWNLTITVKG
jgi:hypothetical protein